jgi:GNAT superfamily N-acetyltransferase
LVVGGITPERVNFKSADADFWKRYHAYRRQRQHESRPDDPQRPDEIEELRLKRDNPFDIEHRYEVASDGVLLSWFSGSTAMPGTPAYEANKHLFWADIYVRPEHRRQRIGASWVPVMLELMDRHGCTLAGISTEERSGHAFLKWLGAEPKLVGAENRLKLADVDWNMVQRWIDEGQRRSPQTRLEIYEGRLPDAMLQDFAPQLTSLLKTIPFEELDIGEILVTPDHMRDWYARMELLREEQYTVLTREPDGVISAMTDTTWGPYRPTFVEQRFTGVRPDARGRGLGKWIKAAMLDRVRHKHPEIEWVVTENAGSNAPMLAINKKLGFKQYRVETEYQISRDGLATRAKELAPT